MGVVVHHKTANVAVEEVSNSSSIMLRFLKADGLKIFLDPTMFYFSLKAFSYVFYSIDSIIRPGWVILTSTELNQKYAIKSCQIYLYQNHLIYFQLNFAPAVCYDFNRSRCSRCGDQLYSMSFQEKFNVSNFHALFLQKWV